MGMQSGGSPLEWRESLPYGVSRKNPLVLCSDRNLPAILLPSPNPQYISGIPVGQIPNFIQKHCLLAFA